MKVQRGGKQPVIVVVDWSYMLHKLTKKNTGIRKVLERTDRKQIAELKFEFSMSC